MIGNNKKSPPGSILRPIWLLLATLLASLLLISCSGSLPNTTASLLPGETTIVPTDHSTLPSRGFFMGILPIPSNGDSFVDAYKKASALVEFVPVWGRPTPFYQLAKE